MLFSRPQSAYPETWPWWYEEVSTPLSPARPWNQILTPTSSKIAVRLLQCFISNLSRDRVSPQDCTVNDHGVYLGVDECLARVLRSGEEKTDQRYQSNGCKQ